MLFRSDDQAFHGCSNLTNLNLSQNIKYIGCGAFWGCTNVPYLKIPNDFVTIKECVFEGWLSNQLIMFPSQKSFDINKLLFTSNNEVSISFLP